MMPSHMDIHGQCYRVLRDRTVATLRPGDAVRADITRVGSLYPVWQYVMIWGTPEAIRSTRQRRGLPFHRVPSVMVPVRAIVGTIDWMIQERHAIVSGALFDVWKYDTDARFDVFRPILADGLMVSHDDLTFSVSCPVCDGFPDELCVKDSDGSWGPDRHAHPARIFATVIEAHYRDQSWVFIPERIERADNRIDGRITPVVSEWTRDSLLSSGFDMTPEDSDALLSVPAGTDGLFTLDVPGLTFTIARQGI